MTGIVLGSIAGVRSGLDLTGDSFVQATPTALQPLTRYKIRGRYAAADETWVASFTPITPAPSQNPVVETGHIKVTG